MKLFCNTLEVAFVTPNGLFVAPLREFLKYMGCSIMILEGHNKTLHMVLLNSTGRSLVTLLE